MAQPRWICCQLGAREHYAVPRALHRRGELRALVADAWASPGSVWTAIPGDSGARLRERFSPDLDGADIDDFTASLVAHEVSWRLRGLNGWTQTVARNTWFQERAAAFVETVAAKDAVVFANSYAALRILRAARRRGFTTILGQIDPGEAHFVTVREVSQRSPEFGPSLPEPPDGYFADWREECRLADRIVVNSEWSRDSLVSANVEASKIQIVPLPFEAASHSTFSRTFPASFTPERPLRVLFVGSVAAFKGVPSLLGALDHLNGAPVEIRLVGPIAATIPGRFTSDRRVHFTGAVARSEVMDHYRHADVLVFPSHSDGFGMVQVEAGAWRLPIIASQSSGRVVQHGVNGLLLPEVSDRAIAAALLQVMQPGVLEQLSRGTVSHISTLEAFGAALSNLVA